MRIGLMRHFEVECPHKRMMSAKEFSEWVNLYDSSPIKIMDLIIEQGTWEKCYCSDLLRAIETAQHIYRGDITKTELIREVPISPAFDSKIKLPYIFWLLAGRVAWLCSQQSQPESIKQTRDRVKMFISSILEEDNVLIVTHGFLMLQIKEHLISMGFRGDEFKKAKYGEVYVFENNE
ncbi:histidine phosphatase family protein [Pelosinus sp. IPA-1]|uniref:histidine phosphatase family protein n=1 Tax=Pelosinus sp. IPA-1 TaxID=3029569 RepID=UPI00243621C1|nr:histidine phosphatase family protein [Pelosinus sp. IPA-1]GMB00331.1 hypothetical protein PIPA1_31300 [Pelosinus sp. IPA-1]